MTNRKLKNASYNLQMQIVCKETMKNLMTLEIGLTKALKESRAKVKDFDSKINDLAAKFRKEVEEDIFDVSVDRFLASINLSYQNIYEKTRKRCLPFLLKANFDNERLAVMQRAVAEDLTGDLSLIADFFGYGEKRIKRLLDFYTEYNGDPLKEATELFDYAFADDREIRDFAQYRSKRKPVKISVEEANRIKQDLDGLRAFQEAKGVNNGKNIS